MNPLRLTPALLLAALMCGCGGAPTPEAASPGAEKTAAAEDAGLYCNEHGVPEKFCTLCHPELKDKLLLCREHGDIPEDVCTLCHPEVEAKYKIEICPNGHKLPKHFCMECSKKAAEKPAA